MKYKEILEILDFRYFHFFFLVSKMKDFLIESVSLLLDSDFKSGVFVEVKSERMINVF